MAGAGSSSSDLPGWAWLAGVLDLLFRPAADWWWRRLVRWCGTFVFARDHRGDLLRGIPQLIWWAQDQSVGPRPEMQRSSPMPRGRSARQRGSMALSLGHLVFRSGSGGKGSLPKQLAKVPHKVPNGTAEVRDRPGRTAVVGDVLPDHDRFRHPAMDQRRDLVVDRRTCSPSWRSSRSAIRSRGRHNRSTSDGCGRFSRSRRESARRRGHRRASPGDQEPSLSQLRPRSGRSC